MKNQVQKCKFVEHIEIWAIVISLLLLGISSLFSWDDNPVMGLDKMCADSIIVLVCIFVINRMGLWNTAGFQKKGFGRGMLYGIPFLIIGLGSVIVSNVGADFAQIEFVSWKNALLFTANMFLVGMNEEIWMRAFVLNGLLHKYGMGQKGIRKAIIVSALIFGAIHIPNLFFMYPVTVLVQVVNAASAGALFGAIFIKSKNIWAGIIIHAMVDWCSLFIGNCFTGAATVLSMEMTLVQGGCIILLGSLPPILITCLFLRKTAEADN